MKKQCFLTFCVAGLISLNAATLPDIPWGEAAYWKYVETNTTTILVSVKAFRGNEWEYLSNMAENTPYKPEDGPVWQVAQNRLRKVFDRVFRGQETLREFDSFRATIWCHHQMTDIFCLGVWQFTLGTDLKVPKEVYDDPQPDFENRNLGFRVTGISYAQLIIRENGEEILWIGSQTSGKGGQDIVVLKDYFSIPFKYLFWGKGGELYVDFEDGSREISNLPSPPPTLQIAPLDRATAEALGRQSAYGVKLTIQNTGGRALLIECSEDLKVWRELYTFENPDPRGEIYADTEPSPHRFYRVRTN